MAEKQRPETQPTTPTAARARDEAREVGRVGVSVRAVVLGFLLIPLNAYVLFNTGVLHHQFFPAEYTLFQNVAAELLVLALLNAILRRWLPRLAFRPQELITCYIIACAGTVISNDAIGYRIVGILPDA